MNRRQAYKVLYESIRRDYGRGHQGVLPQYQRRTIDRAYRVVMRDAGRDYQECVRQFPA